MPVTLTTLGPPVTLGRPINLGTVTLGSLSLTADELNQIVNAVELRIGSTTGGNITISNAAVAPGTNTSALTLLSHSTTGSITLNVNLLPPSGPVTFNAGFIDLNGSITTVSSLTFTASTALNSFTANGNISGQGVTFNSNLTLDGNNIDQIIDSGTRTLSFVGVTTPVPIPVTITKSNTDNGDLTFNGSSFAGNLANVTVTNGTFINNIGTGVNSVSGTLGTATTTTTLAGITILTGDTTFSGTTRFQGTLSLNGHTATFASGSGGVILTADGTINTGSGTLIFNGAINGTTSGAQHLTINIASGATVAINGVLGGSVPLGSLTVTGAGTLNIGADISTNGSGQTRHGGCAHGQRDPHR